MKKPHKLYTALTSSLLYSAEQLSCYHDIITQLYEKSSSASNASRRSHNPLSESFLGSSELASTTDNRAKVIQLPLHYKQPDAQLGVQPWTVTVSVPATVTHFPNGELGRLLLQINKATNYAEGLRIRSQGQISAGYEPWLAIDEIAEIGEGDKNLHVNPENRLRGLLAARSIRTARVDSGLTIERFLEAQDAIQGDVQRKRAARLEVLGAHFLELEKEFEATCTEVLREILQREELPSNLKSLVEGLLRRQFTVGPGLSAITCHIRRQVRHVPISDAVKCAREILYRYPETVLEALRWTNEVVRLQKDFDDARRAILAGNGTARPGAPFTGLPGALSESRLEEAPREASTLREDNTDSINGVETPAPSENQSSPSILRQSRNRIRRRESMTSAHSSGSVKRRRLCARPAVPNGVRTSDDALLATATSASQAYPQEQQQHDEDDEVGDEACVRQVLQASSEPQPQQHAYHLSHAGRGGHTIRPSDEHIKLAAMNATLNPVADTTRTCSGGNRGATNASQSDVAGRWAAAPRIGTADAELPDPIDEPLYPNVLFDQDGQSSFDAAFRIWESTADWP